MTFTRDETLMCADKNIALFKRGDGETRMRPGPKNIEELLEFERKFCEMYPSPPGPEMDKRFEVVKRGMLFKKLGGKNARKRGY